MDFQQKMLARDLSEETKLLTETFHGMVMKGQMEINEKSHHTRILFSQDGYPALLTRPWYRCMCLPS